MKIAKKVIYYLKRIMYLGLIYGDHFKDKKKTLTPITSSLFGLIGYGDSSYTRDFENKKSIMRYYYFINRAIIS